MSYTEQNQKGHQMIGTNNGTFKRWYGIDILRGLGLLGVILIHGIIQNYAGLDEIDLENLPPLFMVLYVITFFILFPISSFLLKGRIQKPGCNAANL